jgi:hypothetical protein
MVASSAEQLAGWAVDVGSGYLSVQYGMLQLRHQV